MGGDGSEHSSTSRRRRRQGATMRLPRTPAVVLTACTAVVGTALALAPSSIAANDPGASTDTGRYVVVLEPSVDRSGAVAAEHSRRFGAQVTKVYGSALQGYAAAIPASR